MGDEFVAVVIEVIGSGAGGVFAVLEGAPGLDFLRGWVVEEGKWVGGSCERREVRDEGRLQLVCCCVWVGVEATIGFEGCGCVGVGEICPHAVGMMGDACSN